MSRADSGDFEIITSLRYDYVLLQQPSTSDGRRSPFYMSAFHRERMLDAIRHFGWGNIPRALSSLASFEEYLHEETATWQSAQGALPSQPLKLRIALSSNGGLSTSISTVTPVSLASLFPASLDQISLEVAWKLHLDKIPSEVSPHSTFKTTCRDPYTTARARLSLTDYALLEDVLIFNREGKVLESSISSVYLKRDGKWVTPTARSATEGADTCQRGTTRRWALEAGLCEEGTVHLASMGEEEIVVVSNGVKGFGSGMVMLCKEAMVRDFNNRSN